LSHGRLEEAERDFTAQLVKLGERSPEFHLFMRKAHLNLEQYDMALADFQAAAGGPALRRQASGPRFIGLRAKGTLVTCIRRRQNW
jgi:hypothetical protein